MLSRQALSRSLKVAPSPPLGLDLAPATADELLVEFLVKVDAFDPLAEDADDLIDSYNNELHFLPAVISKIEGCRSMRIHFTLELESLDFVEVETMECLLVTLTLDFSSLTAFTLAADAMVGMLRGLDLLFPDMVSVRHALVKPQ